MAGDGNHTLLNYNLELWGSSRATSVADSNFTLHNKLSDSVLGGLDCIQSKDPRPLPDATPEELSGALVEMMNKLQDPSDPLRQEIQSSLNSEPSTDEERLQKGKSVFYLKVVDELLDKEKNVMYLRDLVSGGLDAAVDNAREDPNTEAFFNNVPKMMAMLELFSMKLFERGHGESSPRYLDPLLGNAVAPGAIQRRKTIQPYLEQLPQGVSKLCVYLRELAGTVEAGELDPEAQRYYLFCCRRWEEMESRLPKARVAL